MWIVLMPISANSNPHWPIGSGAVDGTITISSKALPFSMMLPVGCSSIASGVTSPGFSGIGLLKGNIGSVGVDAGSS
jgi:hypothetical protein